MFQIELAHGKTLQSSTTVIMGILNVTPDSFFSESRYQTIDQALERASEMIRQGAKIIDVGGESTRPGSDPVSPHEELRRVIPVVEALSSSDVMISVDTCKSRVAEEALKKGAHLINDISGLTFDQNMPSVINKYDAPAVVMHMQGTPKNMQLNPVYNDVVEDIIDWFKQRIQSLSNSGIPEAKMIIDPGIGFGKTAEHNMELLRNIEKFNSLHKPILIGLSRKSFLGHYTGTRSASERLPATLSALTIAAIKGIDIVRVHDVKETLQVLSFLNSYSRPNSL